MSPLARARRSVRSYGRHTFASLGIRNYRLYFAGQAISLCGTWMQSIGQSWLVLHLTGSGTALGLVTALQCLPILVLAPYGGLIADRFSKRRLLFITQASAGLLAFVLGVLVATGAVRLWMVFVIAGVLGIVNAVDNPTRQGFVHEMVGGKEVANAVALNSVEVNLTRIIGPALAGVVIALFGLGPTFLINAASYVAVLACLLRMHGEDLVRSKPLARAKGQLREGLEYAWNTPAVRTALVSMAIIGTLTFEFSVTLPMLAKFTFHGGADKLAMLTSAMGVGAVTGGLATARRKEATLGMLNLAALGFGLATLALGLSPTLPVALVVMLVIGVMSMRFTALTNTILQLETKPHMRGRVMALWSAAFLGSAFIGGPIMGWIGQHAGVRWALGTGGVAGIVAAAVGAVAVRAIAAHPVPSVAEQTGEIVLENAEA